MQPQEQYAIFWESCKSIFRDFMRRTYLRGEVYATLRYWDKYQVEAIAAARCKEIRGVPEQCMCSREVCAYLRISRSTLTRYVQCGLLSSMVYRKKSDCCACLSHFFHQSDVKCLRYHMNALKQKRALDLREDEEAES